MVNKKLKHCRAARVYKMILLKPVDGPRGIASNRYFFGGWLMKSRFSLVLAGAALCLFVAALHAADKKPVTLKGTLMCAKCELGEASKCQTVIRVKEGGKEVTYFLKDKGNKEAYHEEVCGGGRMQGTVTGIVSEKDGKKWITPTKVEYAKK
jgi:hypothetical protein